MLRVPPSTSATTAGSVGSRATSRPATVTWASTARSSRGGSATTDASTSAASGSSTRAASSGEQLGRLAHLLRVVRDPQAHLVAPALAPASQQRALDGDRAIAVAEERQAHGGPQAGPLAGAGSSSAAPASRGPGRRVPRGRRGRRCGARRVVAVLGDGAQPRARGIGKQGVRVGDEGPDGQLEVGRAVGQEGQAALAGLVGRAGERCRVRQVGRRDAELLDEDAPRDHGGESLVGALAARRREGLEELQVARPPGVREHEARQAGPARGRRRPRDRDRLAMAGGEPALHDAERPHQAVGAGRGGRGDRRPGASRS